MKLLSLDNNLVKTAVVQLARLSGRHGYRLDGDTVHLNAMFELLNPAAHECSWSLQLWACPSAPASAKDLAGHLVAEVALPPMGELADESEHFEVSALAYPPAGSGEYAMVLVLASGHPGKTWEVQDFAVYANRQAFIQPRMAGNVGYRLEGARVQIDVEQVENPRPAANRSGTLSLELWALPEAFDGGRFHGHYLGGFEFGRLDGQHELRLQPMDLSFTQPPVGHWQIVLMLREWTAAGFVTRDFTNFPTRFVSAPPVEKAPAPVVAIPAVAEIQKTSLPIAEKSMSPAEVKAPKRVTAKAPASAVKAESKTTTQGVSVNTADVEELSAVKGLSPKLAQAIIKKRPFSSLDELGEVKGIGAKILAKIRSCLRL
jgi:competence ComEA-like helix-hairpin-helix protein